MLSSLQNCKLITKYWRKFGAIRKKWRDQLLGRDEKLLIYLGT